MKKEQQISRKGVVMIIGILLITLVLAIGNWDGADLRASHNTGDSDSTGVFSGNWKGVNFNLTEATTIRGVRIKVYTTGSPTILNVSIWEVNSSNAPDHAIVSNGSWDASGLGGSPGIFVNISITEENALEKGNYTLVLQSGDAGVDAVQWRFGGGSDLLGWRSADDGEDWEFNSEVAQVMHEIWGIDAGVLTTLNSPANNIIQISRNVTFSATSTSSFLVNVSWFKDGIRNETRTITGSANTSIFRKGFSLGTFNWSVESCSVTGTCDFSENRTFTIANTLINEFIFNTTTFETADEKFEINVSSNGEETVTANLVYNNTIFPSTKVGNNLEMNFTVDLTIPNRVGNNTFYWSVGHGGTTTNSTNNTQSVDPIIFSLCNSSLTTRFLNISFQDEGDLSQINASIPLSTFIYYLGSGEVNKTLEYINSTNNLEYNFCGSPSDKTFHILPNVQHKQGVIYPQRIWNPGLGDYSNATTNQTLYLLNTVDGIFVTFQVINSADQTLSGVDIIAIRSIGGEDFEVGTGTTGADGTFTFFLNPDFLHTFTFSKTGFETFTTDLFPTQTSFTITLSGGITSANNFFKGIEYSMFPQSSFLVNDTTYSFEFNVTSSFWDLTNFGFNLRLSNGSLVGSPLSSTPGTAATLSYDVNNQTIIYMDAFWNIDGNFTNVTKFWVITNTENTRWSVARFFTDLNLYINSGLFGLDDFGRYLIYFIIMFVAVGIISFKYGLTSPLAVTTSIFLITFFLDVVVDVIPEIRGINNLLTYIAGLVVMREATR